MKWINFKDRYPNKSGQYIGRGKDHYKFIISYLSASIRLMKSVEGGWEDMDICCDKYEWLDEEV